MIFYISFILFHFQAGLNIPSKKVFKKSKQPTYPNFVQDVTGTTHIFLFGQNSIFDKSVI